MEKARKHMFIFRMVCVILAIVTALPLCIAGCGKTDKPGNSSDVSGSPSSSSDSSGKVTVESVEITSYPKTDYYPGEVFDITGLVVKANLSNGKSKNYFDADFSTWTHKGEPLTESMDKITLTLPKYDYNFDLVIKVANPTDMALTVDKTALKNSYVLSDTIDFTALVVRATVGNETKVVSNGDWRLFNGEKEITDKTAVEAKDLGAGEVTLTVKYLTGQATFTVNVLDPTKVITPAIIEAEDCVYRLNADGSESENKFEHWSVTDTCAAEYYDEQGTCATPSIQNGASGKSVGGLSGGNGENDYGRKVYFKFKVNVPEEGEYALRMRSQSSTLWPGDDTFAVNINAEKGSDNKLKFSETQLRLTLGYRLGEYADLGTKEYHSWFNLFWWGIQKIGDYQLKKGENEIRVYLPKGISGNIDYFEVVQGEQSSAPKIISMRSGNAVDLSENALHLEKGKTLTDMVNTPAAHPVKYTLLYLRTSTGKDVCVLASMLEGKVDYTKVGAQTVTVVDPVSKEEASFTLIIDDIEA